MREEDGLNPAQRELERALRTLSPAAETVAPLAAAFAAGGERARRQARLWRTAAVGLLVIGAGMCLPSSFHRHVPGGRGVVFTTDVPRPPKPSLARPAEQSVMRLQEVLMTKGVDGLPMSSVPDAKSLQSGERL